MRASAAGSAPNRLRAAPNKTERSHKSLCVVACVVFPLGVVLGVHVASVGFLGKNAVDTAWDRARNLADAAITNVPTRHQLPVRPDLPKVPQGPWDERYVRHLWSTASFRKEFDTADPPQKSVIPSITETLLMGKEALLVQKQWREKSKRFRRYLLENRLSVADSKSHEDMPAFMTNLDMSEIRRDALNEAGRTASCVCDLKSRPVLDMALVIPLEMSKYEMTWSLLESIRQLTVFPKEFVFVVGNAEQHRPAALVAFVGLLRDFYLQDWPSMIRTQVWVSEQKTTPGDSRWFGFNQTSAEIVTQFDNDDYMHPQFFHIFWRIFTRRPELDFALMIYEVGAFDGVCDVDMYFPGIKNFLEKRQYTEEEIEKGESYPNSKYAELWGLVPTFDKEWWLGNTDAEPNWGIPDQQWWDMGCHNGWSTYRRYVMEQIPPPVNKFGGEDAIWNFRVGRAKFNYRCIELVMGTFLKSFCHQGA